MPRKRSGGATRRSAKATWTTFRSIYTPDVDETIEFTFAGDKIARLDLRTADEIAEDAFWG